MTVKRTWTNVGHGHASRREITREIDALTWHTVPTSAPACPGLAIGAVVEQLDLPRRLSAIAWDGVIADRYGLYGIETTYSDGRARIYVLDKGSEVIPVASDFWPTCKTCDGSGVGAPWRPCPECGAGEVLP